MAETGKSVKSTANQRLWVRRVRPDRPKAAGLRSGGWKEIDRPAAMDHLFA